MPDSEFPKTKPSKKDYMKSTAPQYGILGRNRNERTRSDSKTNRGETASKKSDWKYEEIEKRTRFKSAEQQMEGKNLKWVRFEIRTHRSETILSWRILSQTQRTIQSRMNDSCSSNSPDAAKDFSCVTYVSVFCPFS
ncbi:hypothetical protein NPIL_627831 [Nephila pilipes]|uniref:Uncharacterized protein n=1 Tax=Nephila pilipes TaxID=299642 RepID=A0A8X6KL34_NEPPI|nr:hypothetical protein NPIL_627831 [Nephila pilipes]